MALKLPLLETVTSCGSKLNLLIQKDWATSSSNVSSSSFIHSSISTIINLRDLNISVFNEVMLPITGSK